MYEMEDVTIVVTSEKAVLVDYAGEEFWIAKSQIVSPDTEDLARGRVVSSMTVPRWIAEQAGVADD